MVISLRVLDSAIIIAEAEGYIGDSLIVHPGCSIQPGRHAGVSLPAMTKQRRARGRPARQMPEPILDMPKSVAKATLGPPRGQGGTPMEDLVAAG